MPDALDVTRFTLPDFAPGQEQRLTDRERQLCDRDARAAHVCYSVCRDWDDMDKITLACKLLVECVDARDANLPEKALRRRLLEVYGSLDVVFRDMQDMEDV